ncbi:unnamed protein product [Moneuplotes crassus]|uniref:Uncharacterized protein n=1 Tax=Euplotes crassus TaxID=5936 RepID=A0AAD1XYW3_EUPCR|nr:unnamed protein product [Moneuplotes crassus]
MRSRRNRRRPNSTVPGRISKRAEKERGRVTQIRKMKGSYSRRRRILETTHSSQFQTSSVGESIGLKNPKFLRSQHNISQNFEFQNLKQIKSMNHSPIKQNNFMPNSTQSAFSSSKGFTNFEKKQYLNYSTINTTKYKNIANNSTISAFTHKENMESKQSLSKLTQSRPKSKKDTISHAKLAFLIQNRGRDIKNAYKELSKINSLNDDSNMKKIPNNKESKISIGHHPSTFCINIFQKTSPLTIHMEISPCTKLEIQCIPSSANVSCQVKPNKIIIEEKGPVFSCKVVIFVIISEINCFVLLNPVFAKEVIQEQTDNFLVDNANLDTKKWNYTASDKLNDKIESIVCDDRDVSNLKREIHNIRQRRARMQQDDAENYLEINKVQLLNHCALETHKRDNMPKVQALFSLKAKLKKEFIWKSSQQKKRKMLNRWDEYKKSKMEEKKKNRLLQKLSSWVKSWFLLYTRHESIKTIFGKLMKKKRQDEYARIKYMAIVTIYLRIRQYKNKLGRTLDQRIQGYAKQTITAASSFCSNFYQERAKEVLYQFLSNRNSQIQLMDKFRFHTDVITHLQRSVRSFIQRKRVKVHHILKLIDIELKEFFSCVKKKKPKLNKKNKKVVFDYSKVSDTNKLRVVYDYLKFRYNIYGMKFYNYWKIQHPNFDPSEMIHVLKNQTLQLHQELFHSFSGPELEYIEEIKIKKKVPSNASPQMKVVTIMKKKKTLKKSSLKKPHKIRDDLSEKQHLHNLLENLIHECEDLAKSITAKANFVINQLSQKPDLPKYEYIPSKQEVRILILQMIRRQAKMKDLLMFSGS